MICLQHEAKMKTVAESMKTIENKKRSLEDQVDTLNEELASVKAKGTCTSIAHWNKLGQLEETGKKWWELDGLKVIRHCIIS